MIPDLTLNDGRAMPQLGFGVWQIEPEAAVTAVHQALKEGYRLIDTAAIYGNEEGVGRAVEISQVPRDGVCLTTKLWNPDHGRAMDAMDESLARLGMSYVDLYLVHWPCPRQDRYVEAWRGLIEIQKAGKARSIGVSNFTIEHLRRIMDETGVTPAVNQVELHPGFPQAELREFHARHGIVTEAWSPLGRGGELLESRVLAEIGARHGKSPAQAVLRWHLQLGNMTIPKSVTPARIRENLQVFDFELTPEDMDAIGRLEDGKRLGGDPDVANYGVE